MVEFMGTAIRPFFAENEVLALILVVLLFNNCDGLFNSETLAVIIILWLIAEQGFFGDKCGC